MESFNAPKQEKNDPYLTYIVPMQDIISYLATKHPDSIDSFGTHEIWHLEETPIDHTAQEEVALRTALQALKELREIADSVPAGSPEREHLLKSKEEQYAKALYGF